MVEAVSKVLFADTVGTSIVSMMKVVNRANKFFEGKIIKFIFSPVTVYLDSYYTL